MFMKRQNDLVGFFYYVFTRSRWKSWPLSDLQGCESHVAESRLLHWCAFHQWSSQTANGETLPVPALWAMPPSDTVESGLPGEQFSQTRDQGKRGAQGLVFTSWRKSSDPKLGQL